MAYNNKDEEISKKMENGFQEGDGRVCSGSNAT